MPLRCPHSPFPGRRLLLLSLGIGRRWFNAGLVEPAAWASRRDPRDQGGHRRDPAWTVRPQAAAPAPAMSEAARAQFARTRVAYSGPPVDDGRFQAPVAAASAAVTFAEFAVVEPRIAEAVARIGVTEVTPVQRAALPLSLAGWDATVQAETGSGKTLAYLVPMLSRLASAHPAEAMELVRASARATQFPSGLVICPTRELAMQILEQLRLLAQFTHIRADILVGGMNSAAMRERVLSHGLHIAVATPGRLLDFLESRVVSLRACRQLVLDEADRCLDMGFERDIRRILDPGAPFGPPAPAARQTSLFSATFPTEVAGVMRDFLRPSDCVRVRVEPAGDAAGGPVPACIRQDVVKVGVGDINERLAALTRLLGPPGGEGGQGGPCLVFVRTKLTADRLHRHLRRLGHRAAAIHGDMGQNSRQMSLDSFKSGRTQVLVATDVAARGLDLPGVDLVVNFDSPDCPEQYVHRVGRTGRLGRPGRAVTFVDDAGLRIRGLRQGLAEVLRQCRQPVPDFLGRAPPRPAWERPPGQRIEEDDEVDDADESPESGGPAWDSAWRPKPGQPTRYQGFRPWDQRQRRGGDSQGGYKQRWRDDGHRDTGRAAQGYRQTWGRD